MAQYESSPQNPAQPADALFSPMQLGPLMLKNRLVALPIYTGYAHPDGRVSALFLDHYRRLAQSGVSMVVVANAAVAADGIASVHNLRADDDQFLPGLSQAAEVIKHHGPLACLQLNHAGRLARTPQPLSPSAVDNEHLAFYIAALKDFMNFFPFEKRFRLTRYFLKLFSTWRRAMTIEEQQRVISQFADAAYRAFKAGFDLIELHGANGYLLCQFLSPSTHREPSGGAREFAQRTAFPLAVIRAVKKKLPAGFPLGFRLMLEEWVPGGINMPEALDWAHMLEDEGIAYLSATAGSYGSIFSRPRLKEMARPAYLADKVSDLTRAVAIPTIISGRIIKDTLAAELLEKEVCDLIGLGRSLRADVDWIRKSANSRRHETRYCTNCQGCLRRVVLDEGFACSRWPRLMQENTDLEHKLLTRMYKGLWVVSAEQDMALLESSLPVLIPEKGRLSISHSVVFLDSEEERNMSAAGKREFLDWVRRLLQERGHDDGRLEAVHAMEKNSAERELQQLIEKENHGLVILVNDRTQAWRQRLLYKIRGRISILVGPGARLDKMMVPVDFSPSSLLVLKFIGRTYAGSSDFHFDFAHVANGPSKPILKRWQELKTIAGLADNAPLTLLPARAKTADTLLATVREGNYGCIIMGKRGQSGIKRRLLGSVSASVLRGLSDQTLFLVD